MAEFAKRGAMRRRARDSRGDAIRGGRGSAVRTRAIHAAIVLLVLVATAPWARSPLLGQTNADWDWIREHYRPALDALLPIDNGEKLYVAYRFHESLPGDAIEYSFAISREPKENGTGLQDVLRARVRMADAVSIYRQMLKMHMSNPREQAARIQRKVKLRTRVLREETCPDIGKLFRKFQTIRFQAPSFDLLMIDPPVHEIRASALAGTMQISLVDPDEPLVVWALETRSALEKCQASESGAP